MRDNRTGRSLTTYQNDPKEVFAEQAFIHFYCKVAVNQKGQKKTGKGERI